LYPATSQKKEKTSKRKNKKKDVKKKKNRKRARYYKRSDSRAGNTAHAQSDVIGKRKKETRLWLLRECV
jgi:hypothetical protein